MNTQLKIQVEDLGNSISQLSEKDRAFASSLCEQYWKKGLSDKQALWVGRMLERAAKPATAPKNEKIGDLNMLVDLLERAKQHLKKPAIVLRANNTDIRINIAGAKAKVPGSLNICSVGSFENRDWYGRVTQQGEFQPSPKYDSTTISAVALALKAMAADPAKAAAEYGHLTGKCCFCNHPLTTPESTSVGYGPFCAGHFGLPWGHITPLVVVQYADDGSRQTMLNLH